MLGRQGERAGGSRSCRKAYKGSCEQRAESREQSADCRGPRCLVGGESRLGGVGRGRGSSAEFSLTEEKLVGDADVCRLEEECGGVCRGVGPEVGADLHGGPGCRGG